MILQNRISIVIILSLISVHLHIQYDLKEKIDDTLNFLEVFKINLHSLSDIGMCSIFFVENYGFLSSCMNLYVFLLLQSFLLSVPLRILFLISLF